jgi:predicted transcriptional regulator
MKSVERSVLEVLFPQVRAHVLRLLFTASPRQHYVRELMGKSGLALHTVQDELRKLSAIGLVTSGSNGYHRFYRANRNHQLFPHLIRIVQVSAKLPNAKHQALRRQPGRATRRRSRKGRPMRPDRLVRWDLFSSGPKTRRL